MIAMQDATNAIALAMARGGQKSGQLAEVEDLVGAPEAPEPHLPRNAADLVAPQVRLACLTWCAYGT